MNRCPSCRNLVPAGWIACRRCGAALTSGRPAAVAAHGATATLVRPVLHMPTGHDNLLPRTATDNLLPRAHRQWRPQRVHVVALISVLAVVVSAWAASRVVFSAPAAAPSDGTAHTEALVHVAADTARALYNQRGTYASLTPAALASRLHGVTVVAAGTVARANQVSIRPVGAKVLVLASPADDKTCVFERDEPTRSNVETVVTRGVTCNAASAPNTGWTTR